MPRKPSLPEFGKDAESEFARVTNYVKTAQRSWTSLGQQELKIICNKCFHTCGAIQVSTKWKFTQFRMHSGLSLLCWAPLEIHIGSQEEQSN
eukprot:1055521-Karenia_brevis.AAC.1